MCWSSHLVTTPEPVSSPTQTLSCHFALTSHTRSNTKESASKPAQTTPGPAPRPRWPESHGVPGSCGSARPRPPNLRGSDEGLEWLKVWWRSEWHELEQVPSESQVEPAFYMVKKWWMSIIDSPLRPKNYSAPNCQRAGLALICHLPWKVQFFSKPTASIFI